MQIYFPFTLFVHTSHLIGSLQCWIISNVSREMPADRSLVNGALCNYVTMTQLTGLDPYGTLNVDSVCKALFIFIILRMPFNFCLWKVYVIWHWLRLGILPTLVILQSGLLAVYPRGNNHKLKLSCRVELSIKWTVKLMTFSWHLGKSMTWYIDLQSDYFFFWFETTALISDYIDKCLWKVETLHLLLQKFIIQKYCIL